MSFPTSRLSDLLYNNESKLRDENLSRTSVGSYERENLAWGSTAENLPSLPPFLAANIMRERTRRNFYVVDGGAIRFIEDGETPPPVQTKRLYDNSR